MTSAILPAHDVTDLGLASEGVRRIEWAEREMPVLRSIRVRFERDRTDRLTGFRPADLHHMTSGRVAAEVVVEGDHAMHFGA